MSINIVRATKEMLKDNMGKILEIDVSVIGEKWTASNFLLELPGKWEYSILAFSKDELIGFAIFSYKKPAVHLHRLAVDDSFRRSAIASSMIKATVILMRMNKMQTMTANIHNKNAIARSFFESLGFSETGESGDNILIQTEIAAISL